MIAIAQRRFEEAEADLARAWQCIDDKAALAGATAAEHMRALIYGAAVAQRDASAMRTVHTTRLLTAARRSIEFLWPGYTVRENAPDGPAAKPDLCADTLQRMDTLGDAVNTGGGHWIAAPLRLVASDDTRRYLLVGAAPAPAAHQRLGIMPACAGPSRFVSQHVLDARGTDDLVQPIDAWLGEEQPLDRWTAQVLAGHEARMEAVQDLSAEQLDIYAPDVARSQRRSGVWVPAGQIGRALDGVRLCRPQDRYRRSYDPPYCLAHFDFKSGALSLRRCASVSRDLTLRLRFGLDVQMNTPRPLTIAMSGATFSIDRPLSLPLPEARVYSLGWQDRNETEASEKLVFHADALPFLVHALRRICISPSIMHRSAP